MVTTDEYGIVRLDAIDCLYVECTENCKSRCMGCGYWHHQGKHLPVNLFAGAIRETTNRGVSMVMLTGGEPLEHPEFDSLCNIVRTAGVLLKVATNGIGIGNLSSGTIAGINRWTVSLDAACPETYKRVRGVDAFEVIVKNIKQLVLIDKPVRLSFLLQKHNFHELSSFVELANRLGATSISILLPDFRGIFGPHRRGYASCTLLNETELDQLRTSVLPNLERLIMNSPQFFNYASTDVKHIAEYMDWLCTHKSKPQPQLRIQKCALPLRTVLLHADGSLSLCFYFPERFLLDEDDILNGSGLSTARAQYAFDKNMFVDRCMSCVQAGLCQHKSELWR